MSRVILSSLPRRIIKPRKLFNLAKEQPGLIIPAVRAKGSDYDSNSQEWYERLEKQSVHPRFKGIGEAHLYHAAKGQAAEVLVYPSDARITHLLKIVKEQGWPLVLHAELEKVSSKSKNRILRELADLMRQNPNQAFLLTHMAQLEADEVRPLLAAHPNLHFITSHANHIFISFGSGRQPWIDMFNRGDQLTPEWRDLIAAYPKNFVLGFDNTRAELWKGDYLEQIALWRGALQELPRNVAEAVAYKNAERLWKLPPLNPDGTVP